MRIVTFGYAGLAGPDDLRRLLRDDVDVVVDVRINAYSGNRAFSTKTRATVEAAGYEYVHLPGLGNAGHMRGGPMRLADPTAIERVIELVESRKRVALMCVCSDVRKCHRRLVVTLLRDHLPDLEVLNVAPALAGS